MCKPLSVRILGCVLITIFGFLCTIHNSFMKDWLDTTSAKASLFVNSYTLLNLYNFIFLKIIIYELFSIFETSSSSCASDCIEELCVASCSHLRATQK